MKYTKQLFSIIVISLLSINLNAQNPEDVITGLKGEPRFTVNGSDLYIGNFSGIYKMNVNAGNTRFKKILTNNNQMLRAAAFSGDTLYTNCKKTMAKYNSQSEESEIDREDKIVKIYTVADSTVVTNFITTGLSYISSLAINGNMMYIADCGNSQIVKVNITTSSRLPIKVVDIPRDSNNTSMVVHGNYLYYTTDYNVYGIDLTSSKLVKKEIISFDEQTYSTLAIYGNDLYISCISRLSYDRNIYSNENIIKGDNNTYGTFRIYGRKKILKYDITRPNQKPVSAFSNITINPAYQLAVSGNHLYYLYKFLFGEDNHKISRINLNVPLSGQLSSIRISPNPAIDYMNVTGINKRVENPYTIFNSQGQSVLEGSILRKSKVDVQTLPPGNYTLNINRRAPAIFAKDSKMP